MNEILFLSHICAIFAVTIVSLRLGKEALIGWICLQAILANLFVLKQMLLFGFEVTCSDVFAVGSIFGLNLLQEFFGKESARRAILVAFFLLFALGAMSLFQIAYLPSGGDMAHPHFQALLKPAPASSLHPWLSFL